MISRQIWRSQLQENQQETFQQVLQNGPLVHHQQDIVTLSLYQWEDQLFAYVETLNGLRNPEELLPSLRTCLRVWPGQTARYWVPMYDVFHYNVPENVETWRGDYSPEKRLGCIAFLKPEMISSYIFYHYQMQEERPTFRFQSGPQADHENKTYTIGIHENLLFSYEELPQSRLPHHGKLKTTNTPQDWYGAMVPHFYFWDDEENPIWKSLTEVYHFNQSSSGKKGLLK